MQTDTQIKIKNRAKKRVMPLVSVVMPVYNVEQYIEQAVWSVIDQTYGNFELIIVDDESPDNSIELIKHKYTDVRIRIIRQKNRGLAGARNTGIRNAKGDYIALLDSDDFWQADKLQKQIAIMQNKSQCGVTFSASLFVDEAGESLDRLQAPMKTQGYLAKDIFCRNPIGNGSAPIIRKSIFDQIAFTSNKKTVNGEAYLQYFDETLRQSEDVECWTRIALQTGTQFEYIDQPLTNYRLNNNGLSADVNAQFATWLKLLDNTKAYAPEFVNKYGPVAKAFQYRYLARRSVFQAQGRNAFKFMCLAFKSAPVSLFREFKRTSETLFASVGLSFMPAEIQKKLVHHMFAG